MESARITRREALLAVAAAPIATVPFTAAAALDSTEELADIAAKKGITFGCQISSSFFNPQYLHLYQDSVKLATPENDLKAVRLNPDGHGYNFSNVDRVLDFAASNNIEVHGHTLIWANGKYNPPWVRELPLDRVGSFIDEYISTVVGRYPGKLVSWDVVNEPTSLGEGDYPAYQSGPFFDALGPDFVKRAFHAARDADSKAILVLNEAQTERDDKMGLAWRSNLLICLRNLVRESVPIQAVGLQAHLQPQIAFNPQAFDSFLNSIEELGLDIYISELDVNDEMFPDDVAERDQKVAEIYSRFLAVALKHRRVKRVVFWGMADHYSFYGPAYKQKHPDAARKPRPLLLDAEFQRKPAWVAVEQALRNAPGRRDA
jgi:endo-1,4-beta-xylanase